MDPFSAQLSEDFDRYLAQCMNEVHDSVSVLGKKYPGYVEPVYSAALRFLREVGKLKASSAVGAKAKFDMLGSLVYQFRQQVVAVRSSSQDHTVDIAPDMSKYLDLPPEPHHD